MGSGVPAMATLGDVGDLPSNSIKPNAMPIRPVLMIYCITYHY